MKISFVLMGPHQAVESAPWLEPDKYAYAAFAMIKAGKLDKSHRYFDMLSKATNIEESAYMLHDGKEFFGYVCWVMGMTGVYFRPEWRGKKLLKELDKIRMAPHRLWERQDFLTANPSPIEVSD